MRTASGIVKGGLLRGKQSEPVKSVYLDPWLPETARYNFSDKSENAEREKIGSMRAVSCSRRALAYFFDTSQSEYQAPARAVFFVA